MSRRGWSQLSSLSMSIACRSFNIVCSVFGLASLLPLFCAVALAIKWDDGGPIFYSQERLGLQGKSFRLLKFRSMIIGAERSGCLTRSQDCRLTRPGRILRKYKLDELPQLWNVLRGEMQLVGPRPEVEKYVKLFPQQYASLLQDPPGITDPASLAYRSEGELLSSQDVEQQYISH